MLMSDEISNLSFRNFQYKLQDNNIENCFFMNEVKDKKLLNIPDVYLKINKLKNNNNAKAAFIETVKKECANNIWYYFREVVRIPDKFHTLCHDDTGLSMYPLTEKMAKLIYLYDHNLSCVIKLDRDSYDISYITLIYLAIWEEFFLKKDNKITSMIANRSSHVDFMEKFRSDMHTAVWAMNNIICDMEYIEPVHHGSNPWKFKTFKDINNTIPFDGVNHYIDPIIDSNDDLDDFLNSASLRSYKACVGRIIQNTELTSLNVFINYIAKPYYAINDDCILFDEKDICAGNIYII